MKKIQCFGFMKFLCNTNMLPSSVPTYHASVFTTSLDENHILGRGSFATVLKCKHKELGEVVAKCFSVEGSLRKHDEVMDSIKGEVQVLSRLNHLSIVKIIGVVKWSNCMGIIMSYIDGGNLEDFLMCIKNLKEIPWILRLQFAEEIADGLKYLHHHDPKKAFIHGDLKPQNILLTSDLVLKIADFGSVSICLATGATLGSLNVPFNTQHTLYYTAPEFLKHPLNERKPSMDVYSLSMIIYEIITRHRAYDGVNPDLLLQVIKDVGQKPDKKHIRDVESSLENNSEDLRVFELLKNVMNQCWNYKPEERPDICLIFRQLHQELEISLTTTDINNVVKEVKMQLSIAKPKSFSSQSLKEEVKLNTLQAPFDDVLTDCELSKGLQAYEHTPDVDYDIIEFVKRSSTHLENLQKIFEPIAEVDLIQTTSDDDQEHHLFVARFNPQPTQYDQSHFEAECVRLINNFFTKFASQKGHIDATRLQEICDANSWSEENNLVKVKVDSNAGRLVLLGWNHSEPGNIKVVGVEDDVMSVWKWLRKHCDVIEIKEKLLTPDIQFLKDEGILLRIQTVFREVVIIFNESENNEIVLKGMRCEVDSCRVELWKQLKSLHSSTLSFLIEIKQKFVTEALTTCIQTDVNVAEALATKLHQANIRGVLQFEAEPLLKSYGYRDLKDARRLLDVALATDSYIGKEVNVEELLQSGEWEKFKQDLWSSLAVLAYLHKKETFSVVHLVGLTSHIREGSGRVYEYFRGFATVRTVITLPYPVASFLSNFPNEVELDIHFKDVEWNITSEETCGIVINGKRRFVKPASEWMSEMRKSLICESHTIREHGMSIYFNNETGKQFLKTTQTMNKCIIQVGTDQCPHLKPTNQPTEAQTFKPLLTVQLPNTDVFISVVGMDITDISSDAIVNAVNGRLELESSGIAERINLKGGVSIQQDMTAKRLRSLYMQTPLEPAIVTTAGDLPCQMIIHAKAPNWSSSKESWASQCLKNCILAALAEADVCKVSSIAIPAVSSGVFGGKAKVCVKLIVQTIVEYFKTKESGIKQVNLVEMSNIKIIECFKVEVSKLIATSEATNKTTSDKPSKDRKKSLQLSAIRSVTSSRLTARRISSIFSNGEYFHPITVRVKQGDICLSKHDAIVNLVGNNFSFFDGGNLCQDLMKKAGKSIIEECHSNPQYQSPYFRVTSGCQLPCKNIIHVITPKEIGAIAHLLEHVFELADEKMKCNSLALPAIGTGLTGFPGMAIAQSIRKSVENFARNNPKYLRRIKVVVFEEEMVGIFKSVFSCDAADMKVTENHAEYEEEIFAENTEARKEQSSIIPKEMSEEQFTKVFFCSSNQININNALDRIKDHVQQKSMTKVIESRAIACLGLTEEMELMDLETKHNVVVLKSLGESGLDQLSLSGMKNNVADAYTVALKIVSEFEISYNCAQQVVWKYTKFESDATVSFGLKDNFQLEQSYQYHYRNNDRACSAVVRITLNSKPYTFYVDFNEMKGTIVEVGMVLNVIRCLPSDSAQASSRLE